MPDHMVDIVIHVTHYAILYTYIHYIYDFELEFRTPQEQGADQSSR